MGKRKKKQKLVAEQNLVPVSPVELWLKRAEMAEDILLALIIAAAALLFTTELNSHFTLPKIMVASFLVALLQIPLLIRLRLDHCHRASPWIAAAFLALIAWWFIATTQAMHLQTALEGQYGRYNALYTNLMLMALLFALAHMRITTARMKRMVLVSLLIMLPVCLFAFVQYLGLDTMFNAAYGTRPPAGVGNPVALATVLMLFLPFAVMSISYPMKFQQRLSYGLISFMLLLTILITGSRGPWAGVFVSIVVMAVLSLFISRDINALLTRRNLVAAAVAVVVIGLVLSLEGVRSRFSLGAGFDIRLMYYIISLDVIQDSPLFGFGFESFRLIYPEYRPEYDWQVVKDTTPTMIHNDYLQLAADNGLPALIFYMVMMLGILWGLFQLFRTQSADVRILIAILASILGYLAQAHFGWLEAGSSIIYWVVIGLSAGYLFYHRAEKHQACTASYRYSVQGLAIAGLLFCLFYGVLMSGKAMTDHSLRKAQQYIYADFDFSESQLNEINAATRDNFYYQNQMGLLYMKRQIRSPKMSHYHKARQYLFRSAELNPYDAYVRLHIMENDMIAIQKRLIQKPSAEAVTAAREALEIDPNNPSSHRVAAQIYRLDGQPALSQKHLKRMQELKEYDWQGVDERGSLFSGAHK